VHRVGISSPRGPASSSRGFAHTPPPLRIADQRVNRSGQLLGITRRHGNRLDASTPLNLIVSSMWENITRQEKGGIVSHVAPAVILYESKIPDIEAGLASAARRIDGRAKRSEQNDGGDHRCSRFSVVHRRHPRIDRARRVY